MHQFTLKTGTVVHINGIPVELKSDAEAQSETSLETIELLDNEPKCCTEGQAK